MKLQRYALISEYHAYLVPCVDISARLYVTMPPEHNSSDSLMHQEQKNKAFCGLVGHIPQRNNRYASINTYVEKCSYLCWATTKYLLISCWNESKKFSFITSRLKKWRGKLDRHESQMENEEHHSTQPQQPSSGIRGQVKKKNISHTFHSNMERWQKQSNRSI